MIKIAVIDDDSVALTISSTLFKEIFEKKKIEYTLTSFSSPKVFLAESSETKFDLVILDIDMPEENGIDVAKEFREKQFDSTIIFLSQMESLVFDCFKVRPFGFIRKNKLYEDFDKVMSLYFDKIASKVEKPKKLVFRYNSGLTSIDLDSIVYIECKRNFQSVYLKDGKDIHVRSLMSELETKLEDKRFLRIHKGFIINIDYVRRFEGNNVIMVNGITLPLARKRKNEVMQEYLSLTSDNNGVFLN